VHNFVPQQTVVFVKRLACPVKRLQISVILRQVWLCVS